MTQTNRIMDTLQDTNKEVFSLKSKNISLIAGIVVFALVFIFFSIQAQGFFTRVNLIKNLLMPACIATVISLGMTTVMVAGGIDLSISSIAGLAGLAAAAVSVVFDLPFLPMLFAAILVGALIGALNGALVSYGGISPFVVTLSVVFLAQGLQYLIALSVTSGTYLMLPREITNLGSKPWFVIGLTAIFALLLYVFLDRTIFGRYTRAVGENIEAARFSGIPVRLYYWLTFVICGAYCAVGGIMLTFSEGMARVGSGESYLIDAFLLPILGNTIFGRFSVEGTVFGALFMYMIINGLFILGTPPEFIRIIKGGLLLAIILVSGVQKIISQEGN